MRKRGYMVFLLDVLANVIVVHVLIMEHVLKNMMVTPVTVDGLHLKDQFVRMVNQIFKSFFIITFCENYICFY